MDLDEAEDVVGGVCVQESEVRPLGATLTQHRVRYRDGLMVPLLVAFAVTVSAVFMADLPAS